MRVHWSTRPCIWIWCNRYTTLLMMILRLLTVFTIRKRSDFPISRLQSRLRWLPRSCRALQEALRQRRKKTSGTKSAWRSRRLCLSRFRLQSAWRYYPDRSYGCCIIRIRTASVWADAFWRRLVRASCSIPFPHWAIRFCRQSARRRSRLQTRWLRWRCRLWWRQPSWSLQILVFTVCRSPLRYILLWCAC